MLLNGRFSIDSYSDSKVFTGYVAGLADVCRGNLANDRLVFLQLLEKESQLFGCYQVLAPVLDLDGAILKLPKELLLCGDVMVRAYHRMLV